MVGLSSGAKPKSASYNAMRSLVRFEKDFFSTYVVGKNALAF
jgi:hypothetical protein